MKQPLAHIKPQFIDTRDLAHDEFVSSFPGGPAEASCSLLQDEDKPATLGQRLHHAITWPARWLDAALRSFALNNWNKVL